MMLLGLGLIVLLFAQSAGSAQAQANFDPLGNCSGLRAPVVANGDQNSVPCSGDLPDTGDPAVIDFMALMPVLSHPRCANCHGALSVTDPVSARNHDGGYFAISADGTLPWPKCAQCHTGVPAGEWRQPFGTVRWGGSSPATICHAIKTNMSPAELLDHLASDQRVIAGFRGDAAGMLSPADPPPQPQTFFYKSVLLWLSDMGATGNSWPPDPNKGCPPV